MRSFGLSFHRFQIVKFTLNVSNLCQEFESQDVSFAVSWHFMPEITHLYSNKDKNPNEKSTKWIERMLKYMLDFLFWWPKVHPLAPFNKIAGSRLAYFLLQWRRFNSNLCVANITYSETIILFTMKEVQFKSFNNFFSILEKIKLYYAPKTKIVSTCTLNI